MTKDGLNGLRLVFFPSQPGDCYLILKYNVYAHELVQIDKCWAIRTFKEFVLLNPGEAIWSWGYLLLPFSILGRFVYTC